MILPALHRRPALALLLWLFASGCPSGGGAGDGDVEYAWADAVPAAVPDAVPDTTVAPAPEVVEEVADRAPTDVAPDVVPEVQPDVGPETVPDPPPTAGSWEAPLAIGPLPWVGSGDTATSLTSEADSYAPCAPTTDESGPEVVYRLELDEPATVVLTVDDLPGDGVDVDVHVLSAPSPDACVARANQELVVDLDAGPWWIVVDSWVHPELGALAGPYVLSVAVAEERDPPDPTDCLTSPITCDADAPAPTPNPVPSEPAGLGGCPPGMTRVETFCVDRWEAALVLVQARGDEAPWSPYVHPGDADVRAVSAPGLVPQGYIDQVAATAACERAGKRLCTDEEWLRACRGPEGHTYPYGQGLIPGACNESRTCHPVVQLFETTADWIWSALGDPCINQLPDGLAPGGDHPACETAEGAFDMMGNLHEWTAASTGTFRGGFYVDTVVNGPGCLYATTAHNVWHWDYSTGFRCCADPP